ncbi:MAG: glycosyltransferase [Candidatus Moranbacteria bacterium]|nr:glycosyltransferase [Candidatus Moranbacteria bacterium]
MTSNDKNIAIVHDFLLSRGGAEFVLENIAGLFPEAPVFTLLARKEQKKAQTGEPAWLRDREVRESFLAKFPGFMQNRHRFLLPFMPTAVESFDLRDYEWVITSSGAFSKGVVVKSYTKHICYMHSPMRYLWDWSHEYLQDCKLRGKAKLLTRMYLNYLRMWDRASAQRPDRIIANSQYTADRIKKYYNRESEVIYPPVKMDDLRPSGSHQGYFLTVSRLVEYKRLDVLIDAFDKMGLPLVIVGDGPQKKYLRKKIARECLRPDKIKIMGWLERKKLVKMYQEARAFVFASEEDFGIAPAEAMAAGKPVIALGKGGALETVKEGFSGEFFDHCQVEIIADAVRRFMEKEKTYEASDISQSVRKFSSENFRRNLEEYIEEAQNAKRKSQKSKVKSPTALRGPAVIKIYKGSGKSHS